MCLRFVGIWWRMPRRREQVRGIPSYRPANVCPKVELTMDTLKTPCSDRQERSPCLLLAGVKKDEGRSRNVIARHDWCEWLCSQQTPFAKTPLRTGCICAMRCAVVVRDAMRCAVVVRVAMRCAVVVRDAMRGPLWTGCICVMGCAVVVRDAMR